MSPGEPRAVVAGGTGAVGRALLPLLVAAGWHVHAWGRRPVGVTGVLDLAGNLADITLPTADVAFCTLGTTRKQAGSDAAFRAVDHELVLDFARACRRAGVGTFLFVSSAGASATSAAFYLRVKGETERDLASLGFEHLVVVRPSLLLDERPGRAAEQVAVAVARLLAPVLGWLPGRAIEVRTLAGAMIQLAADPPGGVQIVENAELHTLAAAQLPVS